MIVIDEPCLHYWIIESPRGPWSLATCRKCKEIDAFKNSMEDTSWSPAIKDANKRKNKKNKDTLTKKEFLSQRKSKYSIPNVSNVSKYKLPFKLMIVREVNIHGRAEVRKKYGLPETTLRRWVKLYT